MYKIPWVQQGEGSARSCFPTSQLSSVEQGCVLEWEGWAKGHQAHPDFKSLHPLQAQGISRGILSLPNTQEQQTERPLSESLLTEKY